MDVQKSLVTNRYYPNFQLPRMIVKNTAPGEKLDEASQNEKTTTPTMHENSVSDIKIVIGEEKDKPIQGKKTIEEVVNEIAGKHPIWLMLLIIVFTSYGFSVDSLTYLTVFAGLSKNLFYEL